MANANLQNVEELMIKISEIISTADEMKRYAK